MAPDIAVVGGGIAGASVAYHLARETDRRIAVYERGDLAGETTAKSAAFFGFYGTDVERRMKRYGMATYNEFGGDPRGDHRYDLVGRLRVATTPEGAGRVRERAAGADAAEPIDPDALCESVYLPELDADAVAGCAYRPQVGYLDPRAAAREFAERAREHGARFETGTEVTDVEVEGGRVTGLVADGHPVAAEAVVLAAGPWTPRLAHTADLDLPIAHSRAPILRLDAGRRSHTLPIVSHEESGVYLRGDRDGSVLVGRYPPDPGDGTIDPDSVADTVPDRTRREMRRVLDRLVPPIADAAVAEEWVGVRSHTPDGRPIAGPTGVAGLSVVAFDSSGIQLAPAAGRVVAGRLIGDGSGDDGGDEYGAVGLSRFDGFDPVPFSLEG